MTIDAVVAAVCVGPGGIPKRTVLEAWIGREGLEGDGHRFRSHGGPDRAVSLLTEADYAALRADGVDCEPPGAFGENLLLDGEGLDALEVGDRVSVGGDVVLELHDVREPCATLRSVDRRFPELMIGRSGWMCRVLVEGRVRPGDAVRRLVPEQS